MIEYLYAYLFIGYLWITLVAFCDEELQKAMSTSLSLFDIIWVVAHIIMWPISIITYFMLQKELS